jgi:peptidoglycan/LPS O-acetylase OafA/YrhL
VLGAIWFPLYAIHLPVIQFVCSHFSGGALPGKLAIALAVTSVAAAVSYLVAKLYDDPVRIWLRQTFTLRPVVADPGVP